MCDVNVEDQFRSKFIFKILSSLTKSTFSPAVLNIIFSPVVCPKNNSDGFFAPAWCPASNLIKECKGVGNKMGDYLQTFGSELSFLRRNTLIAHDAYNEHFRRF